MKDKDWMDQEELEQLPPWVGITVLTAMAGGVLVLVAELLGSTVLAAVSAVLFFGGIAVFGGAVVAHARSTGTPLLFAMWDGIRSAGTMLWRLAP